MVRKSKVKISKLRRVFNSDMPRRDFDAHVAQLSVLYEDLRIELLTMVGRRNKKLDVLETLDEHKGKLSKYRRHYYLRRSFATIREFAECVGALRKTGEFKLLLSRASDKNRRLLEDAGKFFSANAKLIRTIRNNTGGHFSMDAARHAVENLDARAVGRVELDIRDRKANVKLHYAGELVATAFLRGVDGRTTADKISTAIKTISEAYGHAARVTQVIVAEYLLERFGR